MKYLEFVIWGLLLFSLIMGLIYFGLLEGLPTADHGLFLAFQILTLFPLSAAILIFCLFI